MTLDVLDLRVTFLCDFFSFACHQSVKISFQLREVEGIEVGEDFLQLLLFLKQLLILLRHLFHSSNYNTNIKEVYGNQDILI